MKELIAQRKKEYHDAVELVKNTTGNLYGVVTEPLDVNGTIEPDSDPMRRAVQIAYVRYVSAVKQLEEQKAREELNAVIAEQVSLDRMLRSLFV